MKTTDITSKEFNIAENFVNQWNDFFDSDRDHDFEGGIADIQKEAEKFLADFEPTTAVEYDDVPEGPDAEPTVQTRIGYLFCRPSCPTDCIEFIFWQYKGVARLNEIRWLEQGETTF